MNKLTNLPESTYTFNDLTDPAQGSFGGSKGTFRSYFGAVGIPILDPGNGKISNITHDWANASAGLGGGLAVTVLRMEIRNYRVDIAKERLAEMALKNNCQFVFFLGQPGNSMCALNYFRGSISIVKRL